MVGWKDRKIIDVPITEAIQTYKKVERNDPLVETALSLDVYVGEIK
jgi:6-phosphofructokinase 1